MALSLLPCYYYTSNSESHSQSVKCFNDIEQSAVNGCRQRDENPNSSVVAETLKLLANSSDGYQNIGRNRLPGTRYMNDETAHAATKKGSRDWDI